MVNEKYLLEHFSGKKILITGHTGFKGSWLTLWLKFLGADVVGYALPVTSKQHIYYVIHEYTKEVSFLTDIRDREQLKKVITDAMPDYIFHMAAQPLVRESYELPSYTFDVNVTGTANLLEAAKTLQKKCTVICITTDKVYENKETGILYNEEDRLGGYDPYSASKACAEIVTSSFRDSFFNIEKYNEHKKAIATVRAGNVIGGGDYSKDRIIPDVINALKNNISIAVRNPNAVRPWQHVLEPLGGYLLLAAKLNNNIQLSGAYNFGPKVDGHLTVKDVVEQAIKQWGSGDWQQPDIKDQPHEAKLLNLDITKAQTILNWQPKLTAQKAIAWTIDWYKQPNHKLLAFSQKQIKDYMAL